VLQTFSLILALFRPRLLQRGGAGKPRAEIGRIFEWLDLCIAFGDEPVQDIV
jgi:hypothetical protein